MAKQTINIGAAANDKSGDPLRTAFSKTNSNFNELYALVGGTVAELTEIAQDYAAPLLNHASHTGITFSYDDANNKLIASVTNSIPSVSGNSGKYLYTNGTAISWDVLPLELPSQLNNAGKFLFTNGSTTSWETILTASSSATFTNKTINIQPGQGNVFQINSNNITTTTGNNSTLVLDTNPTINTLFIGDNSNLVIAGGSSSYYWSGSASVLGDDISGVYRNRVTQTSTNSLFTFGANGTGNMSVQIEGSLFVGSSLPSNNGGLNTSFPGWLVVESGGKFGGDINTLGGLIFDSSANGDITFANNATISPSSNNLTINTVSGVTTKTWTFSTAGNLTLPGELHGSIVSGPGGPSGRTVKITPADDASDKKFNFRIDQFGETFTRAYLEFPLAENNKQVAAVFPHANNTNGYIFTQGNNTVDDGMNNAFNIFYNNGNIKITPMSTVGGGTLYTWTFGNNGNLTFPDSTVQTTAYPGITNEHDGSSVIVVGQVTATRGDLSVRLTNNSNTLDVELKYSNAGGQRSISVYRAYPTPLNIYSGFTTKTAGNTTWDNVGNLSVPGNSLSFTVTDQTFHKIYRVTVIADEMPGVGIAGEAYCTIEQLQ